MWKGCIFDISINNQTTKNEKFTTSCYFTS